MKKLIIIILILLPSFAFAGMQDAHKAVIARMNVASGCTDIDKDTSGEPTTSLDYNVGKADGYHYYAGKFEAGSSYTMTKIVLRMKKVGSPTSNITFSVVDDTGSNRPEDNSDSGSRLTAEFSASTLTESLAYYEKELLTPKSITSGTSYWLKIFIDAGAGDNSNYIKLNADGGGGDGLFRSLNDTTYESLDGTFEITYTTIACE